MVVKMTNKDRDFYQYMGKFFGSRLIQKQTKALTLECYKQ